MRDIVVSLESGAGVVRAEHGLLVTDNVDGTGAGGTYLRDADRFHPVKAPFDQERSVVGGLLAPGSVSAEAVDDRGTRVSAEAGGGAYVALIEQPNDGHQAIVCCRDASGRPVRRPWAADYPSVRVTDANEACPACGERDWDEYVPFEEWRGGRGSKVDGTHVPNRVVSCRVCGHEEPEGGFVGMRSTATPVESEPERATRMARVRAELLTQQWLSNRITLRAADFPIYGVEGWPARLAGSGSLGDTLTEITVHHHEPAGAGAPGRAEPVMGVVTRREERLRFSELELTRQTLEGWVRRAADPGPWPEASHAAVTLFLQARARECRGALLTARRTESRLFIDGMPAEVLMLVVPDGPWAVGIRHADLTITVGGRGPAPSSLRLEPIADPGATLLGPEPPDA